MFAKSKAASCATSAATDFALSRRPPDGECSPLVDLARSAADTRSASSLSLTERSALAAAEAAEAAAVSAVTRVVTERAVAVTESRACSGMPTGESDERKSSALCT